jgi:NAD(P)-dependent dehydrogenase (short-subunit alcohol dehydrogenase family)
MKKTVIITGATTGIGKATAIAFGKKGYNVVVTGRNEARGQEALKEIKETGATADFMILDVRNEEDVEQLIDKVVAKFGSLDVMVPNAGISGESFLLADTHTQNLVDLFETNIKGVYLCMKYATKAMLKNGKGSIVNLASIAGLNGILYNTQYCASKHAVVGMTKAAAVEYAAKGIRFNAVAPGAIKTDILNNAINAGTFSEEAIAGMHPMNRMGTSEDIANAIVYLASDESPFMTGSILSVDGGYNAR